MWHYTNSDTRNNLFPVLARRSPSLRPTPEADVLQEDLPDDIEFLSLDSPRYDEPEDFAVGNEDLDTIDEKDFKLDEDEADNIGEWPEGLNADEAVHIEGVPRSEQRLEARCGICVLPVGYLSFT